MIGLKTDVKPLIRAYSIASANYEAKINHDPIVFKLIDVGSHQGQEAGEPLKRC